VPQIARRGLLLAGLLTAFCFGVIGCGSNDNGDSASTQNTTTTSEPGLANFRGVYISTLKNPELANAAGPRAHWPTGNWRMAFGTRDPKLLEFFPGQFQLTVAGLKGDQITFAPDLGCDTPTGRNENSVYKITKNGNQVRFASVKPSCKADAAVLTLGQWHS
jgi:hypothetical protein